MLIKARYVVPVDAPVIEDGGVKIEGGKITAVGPARELSDDATTDYGDAVICPGFVNAHTHLELTSCAGLVPPTLEFTDWLQHLIAVARVKLADREDVDASVLAGIDQSLLSGVTLVGDITSRPDLSRPHLANSALRCVSFGEVIAIGTMRNRYTERLDAALNRDLETATCRVGVSPHAPYTVEPGPMRRCSARADEMDAPIAIHLAETAAEIEFTRNCSGPFSQHLQALGVWDNRIPVPQCSPVEVANRCGVLGPRTVIAHGNYITDLEVDFIARSGASVAYCPRTHDAFGHEPHRFRDMLAAGVNVCIGTDSLASNPSLSILDELRFLRHKYSDLDPMELLRMGTLRGAKALGFADVTGSLTPGKSADVVVIPIDAGVSKQEWASIFDSDVEPSTLLVSGEFWESKMS